MPAPGPPLPPLPVGWGDHSPYPSLNGAPQPRRPSVAFQGPPPLPPLPPGALERERQERIRVAGPVLVSPQPHRALTQSMNNMSLQPGHHLPQVQNQYQLQQWNAINHAPTYLPPRSVSAAPTLDVGPQRPYSAGGPTIPRARTPVGHASHAKGNTQHHSMYEYSTQSRRASGSSIKSTMPPPLAHPWPDAPSLAISRERAFVSGDEQLKIAWARQVLRFVERKQTGGMASSASIVSDPALVRWIDESIAIIQHNCRVSPPNLEALYLRGDLLASGAFLTYVRKDPKAAFDDFELSARLGWAPSWFRVGRQYESLGGNLIAKARIAYERGVQAGDVGSIYRLGMAHLLGQLGLPVNHSVAIQLLLTAADRSDLETSQPAYIYGLLLAGDFPHLEVASHLLKPSPDPSTPHLRPSLVEEARRRIERAAYLNFAPAQNKCGWLYEHAQLGCPFDPLLSVQYYTLASEGGEVEAHMALSKWFLCGAEGCFDKNEHLAFTLAEKAAREGLPTAEFALAYYYEVGVGVDKDVEVARHWYTKAAAQGNTDARERLKALEGPEPATVSRVQHQAHLDEKLQRTRTQARILSDKEGRGKVGGASDPTQEASSTRRESARRQTMRMVERIAERPSSTGESERTSARKQRVRPSEIAANVVSKPSATHDANSAAARDPTAQHRPPVPQVQPGRHGQGYSLSDTYVSPPTPPKDAAFDQSARPLTSGAPANHQSLHPPDRPSGSSDSAASSNVSNASQKFNTFAEMGFQSQKAGDGKECVIC